MLDVGSHVHDRIALWVDGDHADVRLIPRIARPACRVALPGLDAEVMACGQDGLVLPRVTLLGGDVADGAVAVVDVVPTYEFSRPGPGLVRAGEALGKELGAVLDSAEKGRGVGVVVAVARARVGRLHAQPVQHREDRRGLHRGAIVAMSHGLGVHDCDAEARVGADFDALENLRRRSLAEQVFAPEQLKIWQDETASSLMPDVR